MPHSRSSAPAVGRRVRARRPRPARSATAARRRPRCRSTAGRWPIRRSRRPDPSQSLNSIESGQYPGDSGRRRGVAGAGAHPVGRPRCRDRGSVPSGCGSTYSPNAIVGRLAPGSHVALKAIVFPGFGATPHVVIRRLEPAVAQAAQELRSPDAQHREVDDPVAVDVDRVGAGRRASGRSSATGPG